MNKKIIRISVISILLLLIILVFVSNTIYTMLLPEITVTNVKQQVMDVPITTQGEIDYTNIKTVYSLVDGKINQVYSLKDKNIKKGDKILSVNQKDIEFESKKQEIDLKILNENVKNSSGVLKEKAMNEYNIANENYKNFKQQTPSNGIYQANDNGMLVDVFVYNDDIVTKNQKLYSITGKDSKQIVKFSLSYEAGLMVDENSEISIEYYAINEYGILYKAEQISKFYNKAYNTETQRWSIMVEVNDIVKKDGIVDNKICNVSILLDQQVYQKVLPTSSIFTDTQTGNKFVYVVEEKKGIFGGVNVIKSVNVNIVNENSLYTAIESEEIYETITKILSSSDKPISENSECYIKE